MAFLPKGNCNQSLKKSTYVTLSIPLPPCVWPLKLKLGNTHPRGMTHAVFEIYLSLKKVDKNLNHWCTLAEFCTQKMLEKSKGTFCIAFLAANLKYLHNQQKMFVQDGPVQGRRKRFLSFYLKTSFIQARDIYFKKRPI